jgi:UDP-glucose 4-epimerase
MMRDREPMAWASLHGDSYRGQRVLVTGGAGFIGSHLAEALLDLGASVVVLDDLSGGSLANLETLPAVEFVEGSILDTDVLARVLRGCRTVFHEAALGSVPRSVAHPRLYNEVNITGTLNVLEAARLAGARRVVFAASSSAYGDNPVPWVEHMPVLPRSPYAATKVAGEALHRAFSASYGLDTACLRYFNIFGPRQNANSAYAAVIAAFAKSILCGRPPVIFGNGRQSRDFTFVDNAVHANLLAGRCEQPLGGQVINVGCGSPVDLLTLARLMCEALDRPDLAPVFQPPRAGDLLHSFADLRRARHVLGYEPVVRFAAGLRQTIAWYQQALAGAGATPSAQPAAAACA